MLGTIVSNSSDFIALVFLFGFTIFVHELGHFLAARYSGMYIQTFSIGIGPAIWKRKINGITYKIGWIPFGGYVALPQLDPSGMELIQGAGEDGVELPNLPPMPASRKIFVTLAGAAGNIALAIVLAWVIYLSPSTAQEKGGVYIGYVATNSPAYERGLRPGDEVRAVNHEPVGTWNEFLTECHLKGGGSNEVALTVKSDGQLKIISVPTKQRKGSDIKIVDGIDRSMLCVVTDVLPDSRASKAGIEPNDVVKEFGGIAVSGPDHFIRLVAEKDGQATPIVVERKGKLVNLTVTPAFNSDRGRAIIGTSISPGLEDMVMPWMEYKEPMAQVKNDAKGIVRILWALTSRREARQAAGALGGPVMILATLWISIKASLLNAVGFIRFLNVNLAILNLLPIPVLDGGHVLFAMWEGVSRRRVHPKVVTILVNVFASLLISVFVLLTYRDVIRMPSMFRAFNRMRATEQTATNTPPERGEAKHESKDLKTIELETEHETAGGTTNKATP